jgi:hypothetical protein
MLAPPKPPQIPEALIPEAKERQRRRQRLAIAGVAAAAALALGINAVLPSAPPHPTRVPQGGVAAPGHSTCRISNLLVRNLPMSNPTGLDRQELRLTNNGALPCVLSGFPVLRFFDRQGMIPFRYDRDGTVRNVVLQPHHSAYAVYAKYRCDLGVIRTPSHGTIGIGKARSTASFLNGWDPAICKPGIPFEGRTVLVYPFEPNQRLAYKTSLATS